MYKANAFLIKNDPNLQYTLTQLVLMLFKNRIFFHQFGLDISIGICQIGDPVYVVLWLIRRQAR